MSELEFVTSNPKLSIEETFEESKRAMVSIPRQIEPKFDTWIPTNQHVNYDYPILPRISVLSVLSFYAKARQCEKCNNLILPKPSNNFKLPLTCPYCKDQTSKPIIQTEQIKRSSTLQRLKKQLEDSFANFDEYGNFHEKDDYTSNYNHKINHEIYINSTIIKNAAEIKSCIDSLINFDNFPKRYFISGKRTYLDLFDEILNNEGIEKFEPFFTLLTMTSSIVAPTVGEIQPKVRGPRSSPAAVTNQPMSRPPSVDQKTFQ